MQDRLLGCVKKSRGHWGQPPSPCAWSIISYPHTQKRLLPLSAEGLETQMIHAALQRAIWAPSPFPSYFKSLLSSLHWFFLNCLSIAFLPWNFMFPVLTGFSYCPLSFHQAHTCPLALQSNLFGLCSLCYGALWWKEAWHSAQCNNSYRSYPVFFRGAWASWNQKLVIEKWCFCHIDSEPKQTDQT